MKQVAIVMEEAGDWAYGKSAAVILKNFSVPYNAHVISPFRTPARVLEFSGRAKAEGVGVIIAVSGPTAHLSGGMAASTTLPVIAVPVHSEERSDTENVATYTQTPNGVPVATVGSCENAALLALQILALGDEKLSQSLAIFKQTATDSLIEADFMLQQEIGQM
ncbi:N5-carboxyaminoimidazole ribonucleotide mutase [Clostridia bacterium]|nr:N5-carboxyaminoimidazole ribonucleotide mutase [Clostridia bacterium]